MAQKFFDLGQNRNFLWIFKVAENRDSKTRHRAAEIAEKEWVEGSSWRKTRTSIARSELRVLWLRSTLVRAETMPERCVVFDCNNVRSKEKGILLHPISFYGKSESEKQKGRRKWIDFVKSKRAHLEHTENSAMCSEHFTDRGRLHQPICWLFGSEAEERWNRRLCFSEQARSLCSSHQAAGKPESERSKRKVRYFSASVSLPVIFCSLTLAKTSVFSCKCNNCDAVFIRETERCNGKFSASTGSLQVLITLSRSVKIFSTAVHTKQNQSRLLKQSTFLVPWKPTKV